MSDHSSLPVLRYDTLMSLTNLYYVKYTIKQSLREFGLFVKSWLQFVILVTIKTNHSVPSCLTVITTTMMLRQHANYMQFNNQSNKPHKV